MLTHDSRSLAGPVAALLFGALALVGCSAEPAPELTETSPTSGGLVYSAISFRHQNLVEKDFPAWADPLEPNQRITMWLGRPDSRASDVEVLATRVVSAEDGAFVSASRWQRGDPEVALNVGKECRSEMIPLALEPTYEAIVTDAVGPLEPSTATGWVEKGNRRYEKDEDGFRLELRVGASLAERRLVIHDDQKGIVVVIIDQVSIKEGARPTDAELAARCD